MSAKPVETRDRDALERFLRRDAAAQVYGLADLDAPFWPDARAFTSQGPDGEIEALLLRLDALELPIVYAVAPPEHEPTRALVAALAPELPDVFFANLPLGVARVLAPRYEIEPQGEHVKMALLEPDALAAVDTSRVERLDPEHYDELRAFYAGAYLPEERGGRFLARYMLELAPWFGLREAGALVSVAGLHVLSRRYGVAAIGNVATRPDRRGRGLARAVTARLSRELATQLPTIALNVAVTNTAARRCYLGLGFREVLRYDEALLRRSKG